MPGTVRAATSEDVPSLQVIRQQAMEAGFTGQYPRSAFANLVATSEERLAEWIERDDVRVLVGETDVTPVCFGAYDRREGRLLALYTTPEYQGGGWASKILARFEEQAQEADHDRLTATVPLNAVGFFERHGFERERETERDGLAMVVVTKPVG